MHVRNDPATMTFRVDKGYASSVVDTLGLGVEPIEDHDDYAVACIRVNEEAMIQFAKDFAPGIVIFTPHKLVSRVVEDARKVIEQYGELE